MSWTERQRAMLRAMGLPAVWLPACATHAGDAAAEPVAPGHARAHVAVPASEPATEPAAEPAPPAGVVAPVAMPMRHAPVLPAADAHPAAGMDWATLRAAVAGCQACGLAAGRTQTVFGVGHARAHWMIVGEAPGEQEDRQGEPFVGPAGQLLDAMLRAVGLTRGEAGPDSQVYIANTLKCRPPRNRNPEPAELACCEPFLQRQIALVQPRILLAMGRFAVQALLRTDEPIGRLRGRVHAYQGVPLVVTYHPAYLLRQPQDKSKAWEDLCLAASLLST